MTVKMDRVKELAGCSIRILAGTGVGYAEVLFESGSAIESRRFTDLILEVLEDRVTQDCPSCKGSGRIKRAPK